MEFFFHQPGTTYRFSFLIKKKRVRGNITYWFFFFSVNTEEKELLCTFMCKTFESHRNRSEKKPTKKNFLSAITLSILWMNRERDKWQKSMKCLSIKKFNNAWVKNNWSWNKWKNIYKIINEGSNPYKQNLIRSKFEINFFEISYLLIFFKTYNWV